MNDDPGNPGEPEWAKNLEAGLKEGFGPDPESAGSVIARIGARVGFAPSVFLRSTPGPSPVVKPAHNEPAYRRYQIHGEIARGGVGIILKGRDVDLGRDVAMKVIRPEHADSAEILHRFVEEAQIGGQLQHPGIVPVYELGMREDKRAFFTMKLIKGETLAARLEARGGPDEDRRRFLSIFEQICQTVAYAHARGVIHRDLKPANVMIGSFGEVQVVDWGFAKVMTRGGGVVGAAEKPDEEPQAAVRTVRTGSSGSESHVGSVMGTPAFMPPEQALGQTDIIDERSDVFALGAILCEILTGAPPYTRPGSQVLVQAAAADLDDAFARLEACGADHELVALSRRCLDQDRRNRPADAAELAAAVSGYLSSVEERARLAEIDAETAKVKAVEERRARKLTLGLGATIVLALLIGGGSFFLLQKKEREREQQAADAVGGEMRRAERLRGDRQWTEALEAAASAVRLAAGTELHEGAVALLDDVRIDAVRWERNRALLRHLANIRMRREELTLKAADEAYAEVLGNRSADEMAASEIAAELAAYLDEWIWIRAKVDRDVEAQLRKANEIDPDPWRSRLRDAARKADRDELLRLAVAPDLDGHTPNLLARHLSAVGERETAVAILRQAQRRRPDDFWLNFDLGFELTMLVPPQWDEAIGFFRVALTSTESQEVRHQLGIALFKTGRYDDATATWQDALAIRGDLHLYDHIIEAHEKTNRLDELIARYRREADHTLTDHVAQYRLARAYEAKRAFGESVAAYRRTVDLQPDVALFHVRLGYALTYGGDVDAGLAEQRTALELDRECTDALHAISLFLLQKNEMERSLGKIEEAIAIDPYNYVHYLAKGVVLLALRRVDDVHAVYDKALALDPENADAHALAGYVYRRQGRLDRAIESFRMATQMPERAAETRFVPAVMSMPDPETGGAKRVVMCTLGSQRAHAYSSLGGALNARGRRREGVVALREALRREPNDIVAKATLAEPLRLFGELEEAAQLHHDVFKATGLPYSLYFSGFCRLGVGQFEEGGSLLQQFVETPYVQKAQSRLRDLCTASVAPAVRFAKEIPAIRAGTRKWTSPEEQALGVWVTEELGYAVLPAQLFEDLIERAPGMAGEPIPWPKRWHYVSYGVIASLLASRGLGRDAAKLTPSERAHWRRKALEWMKLDLSLWRARTNVPQRKRQYREWLSNGIYALVRVPANLNDMPRAEADEWRAIWDEVRATLQR